MEGVTKITRIEVESLSDEQAATIRKMFVAMSKDIRVIVIKLADRLHNMRTLGALREDRRIFKARETLEIYAPIAHRLGINNIKWELEDLSFYYLEPNKFKQVSRMVTESRAEREGYLDQIISILHDEMEKVGIQAQIMGRPKHLYSIYQKMTKKGKGFSEIYDLIAVRVIVKSVKDCYSALGAVHTLWHPMPGRFKDYIAMPKFNMYQSLHTTVIGPAGRPLEVQIRTEDMHRQSEYGVAAHWRYKEKGGKGGDALDQQLAWLRQMVDWQDETQDSREFLKDLKVDLAPTEVFVFTPKGEVMSLRAGSTPVDFAYAIHTEVGNHCVGAKVNGAIVPLTYELQLGDRVEILTQKSASPSRDWLNIVKTPSARSKIRSYFSKVEPRRRLAERPRQAHARDAQARPGHLERAVHARAQVGGRASGLQRCRRHAREHRHGQGKRPARGQPPAQDTRGQGQRGRRDAGPGCGRHVHGQAAAHAHQREAPKKHEAHTSNGVVVKGIDDVLVRLSRCCNPVPGDEILGFVTRGRGVSVHRADCPNAQDSEADARAHHRGGVGERPAEEHVVQGGGVHRRARPHEPAARRGRHRSPRWARTCCRRSTTSHRDGMAEMRFLFQVSDIAHIDVSEQAARIEGVFDARRMVPKRAGRRRVRTRRATRQRRQRRTSMAQSAKGKGRACRWSTSCSACWATTCTSSRTSGHHRGGPLVQGGRDLGGARRAQLDAIVLTHRHPTTWAPPRRCARRPGPSSSPRRSTRRSSRARRSCRTSALRAVPGRPHR